MPSLAPTDWAAVSISLKVGVSATVLALPFGLAAAYLSAFKEFRGKAAFEAAIHLPLTLPPVVVGYLLLVLLGKDGWLGAPLRRIGVNLLFTWKAAVIASAVVGFPLLVRSIRLGMESVDRRLIRVARTLGAGPLDAFVTVVLPLSLRGILAGCLLMFARSLGEFGATILVAGSIPGVTRTIPLAIYDYAGSPGGDSAAASLCLVSAAISLTTLAVHESLARRSTRKA